MYKSHSVPMFICSVFFSPFSSGFVQTIPCRSIGPGLTVINGMSYNSQAKVISFYYEIIPLRTVYCKGYNWNFTTGKPKNWLCRIGDSPLRKPNKRIKMGAFAIATPETWKLWRTYQRTNILEKLCWASCVGPLSLKSSMDLSVSGDRIFPEY